MIMEIAKTSFLIFLAVLFFGLLITSEVITNQKINTYILDITNTTKKKFNKKDFQLSETNLKYLQFMTYFRAIVGTIIVITITYQKIKTGHITTYSDYFKNNQIKLIILFALCASWILYTEFYTILLTFSVKPTNSNQIPDLNIKDYFMMSMTVIRPIVGFHALSFYTI
jgi:hypothetical protein